MTANAYPELNCEKLAEEIAQHKQAIAKGKAKGADFPVSAIVRLRLTPEAMRHLHHCEDCQRHLDDLDEDTSNHETLAA